MCIILFQVFLFLKKCKAQWKLARSTALASSDYYYYFIFYNCSKCL